MSRRAGHRIECALAEPLEEALRHLGGGTTTTKIHREMHRMAITDGDPSGSAFDDVNLADPTCENVSLSGGAYHGEAGAVAE